MIVYKYLLFDSEQFTMNVDSCVHNRERFDWGQKRLIYLKLRQYKTTTKIATLFIMFDIGGIADCHCLNFLFIMRMK